MELRLKPESWQRLWLDLKLNWKLGSRHKFNLVQLLNGVGSERLSIGLLIMQERQLQQPNVPLRQLHVKLQELQKQLEEKQRELLVKLPGSRRKQLRQLLVKQRDLLRRQLRHFLPNK